MVLLSQVFLIIPKVVPVFYHQLYKKDAKVSTRTNTAMNAIVNTLYFKYETTWTNKILSKCDLSYIYSLFITVKVCFIVTKQLLCCFSLTTMATFSYIIVIASQTFSLVLVWLTKVILGLLKCFSFS